MASNTEALGFDWVNKETASARTVIVAESIFPYRLAPIEIGLEKKNPTSKRILSCLLYDASVQDFTLVSDSVQKPPYIAKTILLLSSLFYQKLRKTFSQVNPTQRSQIPRKGARISLQSIHTNPV